MQLRKERVTAVPKALALGLLLAALMAVLLIMARPAQAQESHVQAWGDNWQGQLGNGTHGSSNSSNTPVSVSDLSTAKRVDGACLHSLALKKGKVYAWGNNEFGQLGAQTPTFYSDTPVQTTTASGEPFGRVTRISTGCLHNLALKKNGTVWAWGNNESGQLGNGTKGVGTPDSRPEQVSGLSNVKAVAAGGGFSLALKKDGTVWAWGENVSGQLGDGTNDDSYTPIQVSNLTNVKAISAGAWHALAIKEDGTVWAWGWNFRGQLGDGTSGGESSTPIQVKGPNGNGFLTDVKAVAAGNDHSLALKKDGTVFAWGENVSGQLGDSTYDDSYTPVQVTTKTIYGSFPLTDVKAISAGRSHSLALKTDRAVWAWGFNNQGQLGDGTFDKRNRPVAVKTASGDALSGIKTIGAGSTHSLGVKR